MISEDELRAARAQSRRAWSMQLLPLVPVVALVLAAGVYWVATAI
jgi:hypothetical protein